MKKVVEGICVKKDCVSWSEFKLEYDDDGQVTGLAGNMECFLCWHRRTYDLYTPWEVKDETNKDK